MKNISREREKKKFKRLGLTRRKAKDVKARNMGTRNEGMRLRRGECRLHIRKRLSLRVAGPWNRFPREAAVAPSLPEYKEHLKDTL